MFLSIANANEEVNPWQHKALNPEGIVYWKAFYDNQRFQTAKAPPESQASTSTTHNPLRSELFNK